MHLFSYCVYLTLHRRQFTHQNNTVFSPLLFAVCQQKERTFETRSLSAEFWQSCWTTRRDCLTQRTMMSPPPTTTAPLMNRYHQSYLFLTSSSFCHSLPLFTVSVPACISGKIRIVNGTHLDAGVFDLLVTFPDVSVCEGSRWTKCF